jgi:ribosome modulation factor
MTKEEKQTVNNLINAGYQRGYAAGLKAKSEELTVYIELLLKTIENDERKLQALNGK